MERFNPAHMERLVSEQRYRLMPPGPILDVLPLRPDAVVGDVGCGPGYFALPLAERVPQGMVHAIDVEPAMLRAVEERAGAAGSGNIRTLLVGEREIALPPGSFDGLLFALVYHEVPERRAYLAMLRELVRPGGWLALLDWGMTPHPAGGPPLSRRIPPGEAADDLAASGWRVVAQPEINAWLYLLIGEREATAGD
ncbi:MAG: class I SAM-dependent methyltransferase [Thermomicrobiales bacterium]